MIEAAGPDAMRLHWSIGQGRTPGSVLQPRPAGSGPLSAADGFWSCWVSYHESRFDPETVRTMRGAWRRAWAQAEAKPQWFQKVAAFFRAAATLPYASAAFGYFINCE